MLAIIRKICIIDSIEGLNTCGYGEWEGLRAIHATTNQVFASM